MSQIITAIKTATRFKHSPLQIRKIPVQPHARRWRGPLHARRRAPVFKREPPVVCVISTEELQSLVFSLGDGLSLLESQALTLYLEGNSYEDMAEDLDCDTKTIDNALQRDRVPYEPRRSSSVGRAGHL